VRPLATMHAALSFCGVTPRRARIFPASLSLSSGAPASGVRTVTKTVAGFSDFLGLVEHAAIAWREYTGPPRAGHFGKLGSAA